MQHAKSTNVGPSFPNAVTNRYTGAIAWRRMDARSRVNHMSVQGADLLAGSSLDADSRTKLVQVLRIYCAGLDPVQLDDLHASLTSGRYPWLEAAFAVEIADDIFSQQEWNAIVGRADDPGRLNTSIAMRADQQLIWSRILPDQRFPVTTQRQHEDRPPYPGGPATPASRPTTTTGRCQAGAHRHE